jgi:hypothetical protein
MISGNKTRLRRYALLGAVVTILAAIGASPGASAVHKLRCNRLFVIDSRGSGEPQDSVSPPGQDFYLAFTRLLRQFPLDRAGLQTNPYPAVGVFGWKPGDDINGLGAFLHDSSIGHYHSSVDEGRSDLHAIIKKDASECPATSLILVGYSQGAEVAGDTYQELSPSLQNHVGAVVLFGDPKFNARDSRVDHGTYRAGLHGVLGPRPRFPSAYGQSGVIVSYCNRYDPICQYPVPLKDLAYHRLTPHKSYWNGNHTDAAAAADLVFNEVLPCGARDISAIRKRHHTMADC